MGWEGARATPFSLSCLAICGGMGARVPPFRGPSPPFPLLPRYMGWEGARAIFPGSEHMTFHGFRACRFYHDITVIFVKKSVVGGGVVGWWLCVGVVVWRLSTHTTHSHGGQGWIRGYRLWWGVRVDEYMPLYVEKGVHGQDEQSPRGRQPRSP